MNALLLLLTQSTPHRIGSETLKFINLLIRFYHEVDSNIFTKYLNNIRASPIAPSPLSTKPPCPETPYHACVALSVYIYIYIYSIF